MNIHYENLDSSVREAMIRELELDEEGGRIYISPRLTEAGIQAWPGILREAFGQHDDSWIASALMSHDFIRADEERHMRDGRVIIVKTPSSASDTLAEGEFNRFYARGLCVSLLDSGESEVEVYRGKIAQNPRVESEALIGSRLSARQLLDDLRTSQGVEPALGLPVGPNSGLSVRRTSSSTIS